MPVIGSGDGHRIDVSIVEHSPEIRFSLRIAAVLLLQERQRILEVALVDVDDMADTDVGDAGQMLVVVLAAAARGPRGMAFVGPTDANDRDVDRVVRAFLRARPRRQRSAVQRLRPPSWR